MSRPWGEGRGLWPPLCTLKGSTLQEGTGRVFQWEECDTRVSILHLRSVPSAGTETAPAPGSLRSGVINPTS